MMPGEPLEDFEEGASDLVTKSEAMALYCLPAGTVAVCAVVEERANPHHPSWKPMILYSRAEVRARAHKRYGGLAGLQQERRKRMDRKFAREMERASEVFKR
jgi:XPA protein C-terminus